MQGLPPRRAGRGFPPRHRARDVEDKAFLHRLQRPSDMDPSVVLRLTRQEDGDIIVSIGPAGHRLHEAEVEFCTVVGGTASPHTMRALRALLNAMEADNATTPPVA